MARKSPADKLARLVAVTKAWERLRPSRSFFGLTLAQFKRAIQPSHDTRAEIAQLRARLRIVIENRDRADAESFRILRGVAFAVLADPAEGDDGELYPAMGYVRRSARRKRRSRKGS